MSKGSTSAIFLSSKYSFASFKFVLNHKRSLFDAFRASRVISYISDSTLESVDVVSVSNITLIASGWGDGTGTGMGKGLLTKTNVREKVKFGTDKRFKDIKRGGIVV